jgi:hypothetical protein
MACLHCLQVVVQQGVRSRRVVLHERDLSTGLGQENHTSTLVHGEGGLAGVSFTDQRDGRRRPAGTTMRRDDEMSSVGIMPSKKMMVVL